MSRGSLPHLSIHRSPGLSQVFQKASYQVGQIKMGTGYLVLPCFLHRDPEGVSPQRNCVTKVKAGEGWG